MGNKIKSCTKGKFHEHLAYWNRYRNNKGNSVCFYEDKRMVEF